MRANCWSWMVLAAVAALATTPAVLAAPTQHVPTALERTAGLMEALEHHRYTAACEFYDPMFWTMVGFRSRDCPRVLRQTFPKAERVAYRIHFGGRVGPSTALVIASMALGDAARICAGPWNAARHCARGSAYYFELTWQTLLVDWRGRHVREPRGRWYVSSVGGV